MSDTVFVKCENRVLQISADLVDRYVAKGYDVINPDGSMIAESIPKEYNALRVLYEKKLEVIKELEATIEDLNAQLVKFETIKKDVVENTASLEIETEPVSSKKSDTKTTSTKRTRSKSK